MSTCELAFIGGGNMAEAIVRGVLAAGLLKPAEMIVSDPAEGRREVFEKLAVAVSADNKQAAASAGRLLLAVKPQMMDALLAELAPAVSPDALIISIAAGVSTRRIETGLAVGQSEIRNPKSEIAFRVVRVMPNTPMLVGAGVSGLVKGTHATDDDLAWAKQVFDAAGRSIVLTDEKLIDAVTAVSGSGPAYFFYLIEQLVAAGVAEGLTESDALTLATQTAAGSAKLLAESKLPPAELRRRVTSPGGTTQAACELLDRRDVADAIRAAVRAAAERSRELGARK
jgi:pyrroline-5-carboxylate reductase